MSLKHSRQVVVPDAKRPRPNPPSSEPPPPTSDQLNAPDASQFSPPAPDPLPSPVENPNLAEKRRLDYMSLGASQKLAELGSTCALQNYSESASENKPACEKVLTEEEEGRTSLVYASDRSAIWLDPAGPDLS